MVQANQIPLDFCGTFDQYETPDYLKWAIPYGQHQTV